MTDSNERLIHAYVEQLMKIQQEHKPLTDKELNQIAIDLGISDDEMQIINLRFSDYLTRGLGYSRYEDWDSAIEELEQAVVLKPNHIDALYGLANAYKIRWAMRKSKDDLQKAKNLAKRVLHLLPSHELSLKLSSELNRGLISTSPNKGFISINTQNQFPNIEINSKALGTRLKRSSIDKKVLGVCGGLAEYFGIDATIIRILAVISIFVTSGASIPAYLIIAFILPKR